MLTHRKVGQDINAARRMTSRTVVLGSTCGKAQPMSVLHLALRESWRDGRLIHVDKR